MKRRFSIITVSKSRLGHLKLSLPRMMDQWAAEVIVVDYSCPEGTRDYVREHFPAARVVTVDGETYFSNWKARNAGAAAATSDILVFCDADAILAEGAAAWLDGHLPPRSFGFFKRAATEGFNKKGLRLAFNQLKGFHVVPAPAFRRAQGYDELLEGYAAGADTDLEGRLFSIGLARFRLDPAAIVEGVLQHGDAERLEHHREPIKVSYGAGLIYRTAKLALLKMERVPELPLQTRQTLYELAHRAATTLGTSHDSTEVRVKIREQEVGMPLQLGFENATLKLSLRVELCGKNRLDGALE